LANRLGIIHRGQLIATGTLNEIKELSATKEERLESLFLELTTQVQ
jgi:ABC-2 type transport system ATP-binding protein